FSEFDTLQIELKGDQGGERVIVNIEDAGDPQDGTSTRIELVLTDQWQTYEIDLNDFKTADLSTLFTPFAFVFLGDPPVSFSVRSVAYKTRHR
ncbi:MAG: hypothetical protein R3200_12110, partial [Xanthomonadales bacterium]|nr:hypothetical protein [Xanthomonadales bacterium]